MPLAWLCSMAAVVGTTFTYAFGAWPQSLTVLLIAMGVDYLTGIAASMKEKKGLNSHVGSWGLTRKGLTLLIVLLAHQIDLLLHLEGVTMSGAIYFYLANELISITENYGRIGLPLPDSLRQMIEVLKDKGGSKDNDQDDESQTGQHEEKGDSKGDNSK
ncbi:toxin secretion/phage lysis holin [Paenibacillus cellulosilyticus]|uniref:Toxin secretion/phage lysis holin n=1 Tax=Paenibacillus cellulosilyticus TaxID=375489 RepID=A0A2V2YR91_9BACL|nr:phage holin family protein [Paenibacillus cellulosilyticus]PWV99709.1 toxin secretion/phage lysis holin [Paenibacillus cellulosilyticus]QKS44857.1 phage holin family protein [Paenibacillus cellulosilyticus]